MNRADSNIMETLLKESGMIVCEKEGSADVIIMNTCSVREHAESRVKQMYHYNIDLEPFGTISTSRQEIQKAYCFSTRLV